MKEGVMQLTDESVEAKRNFSDKPARTFRPQEGKVYRIRFPSLDVVMRARHFNPIKKRYYRCLAHTGFCPVCVAASNKDSKIKGASETFGANIFVYDTADDGSLVEPLNAEVHFWAFGSDKFVALRNIGKEWGDLTKVDLILTCTDAKFQKVTFSAARKCAYEEGSAEFKASCDKKLKEDSYPLDKFLCKEVPMVQMCEDFGLSTDIIPAAILKQMNPEIGQEQALTKEEKPAQAAAQPAQDPTPPKENFASIDSISKLL